MARQYGETLALKCEFSGCKHEVKWAARKLWGKGGMIYTCDKHKPGGRPRPASLQHLPSFYEVTPVDGGQGR